MDSTTIQKHGLNQKDACIWKKGLIKQGVLNKNIMSQTEEETQNKTQEEINALLEEQKQTINNLVEELKGERTKKQEAEEAAKKLLEDNPTEKKDNNIDISAALQVELDRRAQIETGNAKVTAEQEFRNSISEFSTDNDPGDIKYNQFKKEMAKFNFDGLKTKEEIQSRMQEVYDFANRKTITPESKINQFASTTQGGSQAPVVDTTGLSKTESDLINEKGWSKDKYLKLKEKQPAFIQQILRSVK